MKIPGRNKSAEIIGGKVALLLLISVAALSSAVQDLNHMHELASKAAHSMYEWFDAEVVTVQAQGVSFRDSSCSAEGVTQINGSEEFRWKGRVPSGKAIEIKGINGDIDAQPAAGDEIEVFAKKKAHESDPNAVRIQVVRHAGGVTICAMYPSGDPDGKADCVPGSKEGRRNHSTTRNARNNDVRVDFVIRVPAGVEFVGRTINGEISTKSPGSNVETRRVNGSPSISATAKTMKCDIPAKPGNANSAGLNFKALNGEISANLPPTANTEIGADPFNGTISLGLPLALPRPVSPDHGTVDIGGRELKLRTSSGIMNLRRVG